MIKGNRIQWLDIMKGICMILIILSHSYPPEMYVRFYTPFFLTAFFFASGYTFSSRDTMKSFLLHKIQVLLVPYWCFGILNAILAFIADGDNLLERFWGLLLSINLKNDDLWFIPCLFIMTIIFYVLWSLILNNKKIEKKLQYIIFGIISIILSFLGYFLTLCKIKIFFQFEIALVLLPFMVMGYIWKQSKTVKKYMEKRHIAIFYSALYFIIITQFKNMVNIHEEIYSNYFLFMFSAFIGTAMIVVISQIIEKYMKKTQLNNCLIFIGQNTFIYYAFQSKVIRILDIICKYITFNSNKYILSLIYAAITCSTLLIPAIIINKWFPNILGKRNIREKNGL